MTLTLPIEGRLMDDKVCSISLLPRQRAREGGDDLRCLAGGGR
jgi:hypothetical protein